MDSSSSTHPLLVPRFKVIADYPKSIHKVGTIYNCGGSSEDLLYCDYDGPRMRDYPHLFEPLPWYAERKPEEMPQYIKTHPERSTGHAVYKVNGWVEFKGEMRFESDNIHFMSAEYFLPATESEYNAYLQSQTK